MSNALPPDWGMQSQFAKAPHDVSQASLPLQQPAPVQAQLPRMRGASQPATAPPKPAMDVGAYHVSPSVLMLGPGKRAHVDVTLRAQDTRVCQEHLAIDVSDRSAPAR